MHAHLDSDHVQNLNKSTSVARFVYHLAGPCESVRACTQFMGRAAVLLCEKLRRCKMCATVRGLCTVFVRVTQRQH
jgi:hypothetical protein